MVLLYSWFVQWKIHHDLEQYAMCGLTSFREFKLDPFHITAYGK